MEVHVRLKERGEKKREERRGKGRCRSVKTSDLVSTPRSHKRAKTAKLLSGYKIFLTRSIKPERDQMADIIKCAGGEVLLTLPLSVGEGVVIVACEEDIGSCKAAMEAGVPVHSTELILGGVLHQELDLHSYPTLSSSCSSLFLPPAL